MCKAWVIWFGFACSFLVGMVWGAIPKVSEFLKVENLHDWAEIMAAIATVVGVFLAVVGYNSWREQAVAEADHDLSRRASLSLKRYKSLALRNYALANKLVGRMDRQVGYRDESGLVSDGVKADLMVLKDAHSEILSIAWECKDSWGDDVWDNFDEVFTLVENCRYCNELFVRWSNISLSDLARDKLSSGAAVALDFVTVFVGSDLQAVEAYVEERCKLLNEVFKEKRLA